jgi:hypothetical protein
MIPITDEVSDGLLARLTSDERRTLLAVLAKLTDERAEQP